MATASCASRGLIDLRCRSAANLEDRRERGRVHKPVAPENWRAYWDDCIAKELEPSRRQKVNRVTKELSAKGNFCREVGIFSLCGVEKKVIEAIKYDFLAHRPNLPGTLIVWRPYR